MNNSMNDSALDLGPEEEGRSLLDVIENAGTHEKFEKMSLVIDMVYGGMVKDFSDRFYDLKEGVHFAGSFFYESDPGQPVVCGFEVDSKHVGAFWAYLEDLCMKVGIQPQMRKEDGRIITKFGLSDFDKLRKHFDIDLNFGESTDSEFLEITEKNGRIYIPFRGHLSDPETAREYLEFFGGTMPFYDENTGRGYAVIPVDEFVSEVDLQDYCIGLNPDVSNFLLNL